ncbi:hypothetical protein HJC23_012997 [Cyclotella cryptica]|uniref:RNA helicase n=1 Tax=Cyclotella cryptica TaxID=29204 RepID=A0ABD3QFZ9_9STRA|eukprot:CCRYP_005601-RB/>CCRYP_005601-RB protein AED:0.03 eAED:0.03 QI:153/1/1/1/1/1/4/291/687
MGKRKRQHKSGNEESKSSRQDKSADDNAQVVDDGVHVRQEPADCQSSISPAWSTEFVQRVEDKSKSKGLHRSLGMSEIGLQLVRGTFEVMEKRLKKKTKYSLSSSVQLKPSPIQLNMWPLLLGSYESANGEKNQSMSDSCNVIGIAQTGSGKTLSYSIPVVANCVQRLLSTNIAGEQFKSLVHGVVLCPTRELAIQVSTEMGIATKVANKMLIKAADTDDASTNGSDPRNTVMKVESIAIYGGVDIQPQMRSLGLSCDGNDYVVINESHHLKSLVIAATPGRLLDVLKQLRESQNTKTVHPVFGDVRTIIFDEADRMALNAEMACQIDEILSILKVEKESEIVTCLVSATLPQKTKEIIDRWVPCRRVVIKVDSVQVGEKEQVNACDNTHHDSCSPDNQRAECDEVIDGPVKPKLPSNLDLATIPSNLVQTLHVCAAHKKPKKLILTLQRIYKIANKSQGQRPQNNNRLCIVFFAQIKTLKFISKLLYKEDLKCVELFGTLQQDEREQRLLSFKAGKYPILLASDVASRGIHVPNVHYVVNYDFPGSLDQYVHRCGRAGRNQLHNSDATTETPPTVFSFFTREFSPMADSVIELLRICNAHVDPNLLALSSSARKEDEDAKTTTNGSRGKKQKKKDLSQTPRVDNENEGDHKADSDDEQFSFLDNKRIVLKRASHVSDPEDSDDEES